MKNNAPFQYLAADAGDFFSQYIELRRRVYREEYPWLPPDFGYEDETDRISRIVLAVAANTVGGGGRLTISTPEHPRVLPLEEAGFNLVNADFLKPFNLSRRPYGEISRMAADPACAHGFDISRGLLNALCTNAATAGADVLFGICPPKPARINDINAKKLGLTFHQYRELPTVFGVSMSLCAFSGLLRVYGHEGREAA